MPSDITDAFTQDHHRCDRLLAEAESVGTRADWAAIETAASALTEAMLRHFSLEEETLFPELEQVFAAAGSPIAVMCSEHAQMRQLLADLGEAVAGRDAGGLLGVLETLHFLVQQHNYKEESVLYPMADRALPERGDALAGLVAHV